MTQTITLIEAARVVLMDAQRPMRVGEIWDEISRRGLFASTGRTPEQTLATEMLRGTLGVRVSQSRKQKLFFKDGPSTFGLIELLGPEDRKALEDDEAALTAADASAAEPTQEQEPGSLDLPTQSAVPSEGDVKLALTHRRWAVPILRALQELGGAAAPRDVQKRIRDLYRKQVTDAQFAHVIKNKHIRFARLSMKKAGLLAGEHGEWKVTNAGSAYLSRHLHDPVDFAGIPALTEPGSDNLDELETVKTTAQSGYDIPVLQVLKDGSSKKQEIMSAIGERYASQLLPGDFRYNTQGNQVYQYRSSWTLTRLKGMGQARNTGLGRWEITETGRRRLEEEGPGWDLARFQDSEAKVRAASKTGSTTVALPPKATLTWDIVSARFPDLAPALARRIRPDLGATPTSTRQLARNIVLYGPPGTGKTHVAKLVAAALTGEPEPTEDGAWRIVQFHPSYAYEDFVQGLRPDLEHGGGQYELKKGPFIRVCAEAEEDPDRFHVLVIDEINRGDPARIFGELLYAIEYRDEAVDLALDGQLVVPPNLVLVGTMNSVDRSVALVDYALRRRFSFIRVDPDPDVIVVERSGEPGAALAAAVLTEFNAWLSSQLDGDHVLGHSFFLDPAVTLDGPGAMAAVWEDSVSPLMEEYFHGDPVRLAEAGKAWQAAIAEAQAQELEDEQS